MAIKGWQVLSNKEIAMGLHTSRWLKTPILTLGAEVK